MKILLITGTKRHALNYFRLTMPYNYMALKDDSIDVVEARINSLDALKKIPDIEQFNAVHFQRQINDMGQGVSMINYCKSKGLKVILDVDDYWHLPAWHKLKPLYKKYSIADLTQNNIAYSDYVTTTTPILADIIRPLNKNVVVFPNCIDFENQKQYTMNKTSSDKMRFGWVGGVYHKSDILPARKSFVKLWNDKNLTGKFKIVLGGYSNNSEYNAIAKTMYPIDEIKRKHDPNDFVKVGGKPIDEYASIYNDIDVSLVFLRENEFNICKSELKIIEAAAMGCAVIVSDVLPYNTICNKDNSILVDKNKGFVDWYKSIKKLLQNPEYTKTLNENLRRDVQERFNIEKINQQRVSWLRSVLA